ncbi:MAG TPA: hypothetical protein DDY91_21525 [Planctomycetaceae bacterium]|nr:hypothetical protein [Planctomycetaceae bacterium]
MSQVRAANSTKSSFEVPKSYVKTSPFERVSSLLLTVVAALVLTVGVLSMSFVSKTKFKPPEPIAIELTEDPGGSEDGAAGETLRVDSALPEVPDASPDAEVVSDVRETAGTFEAFSEIATSMVASGEGSGGGSMSVDAGTLESEVGLRNAGTPGSAKGTGRRPLGRGKGKGGFPREDRWNVRFSSLGSIDEYAKQLDYFGIELAAVVNGKMTYLSEFTGARPKMRTVASGKDETRLYFTWQGGERKQADVQLFRKAGLDVGNAPLLHFYPKATEDALALLEFKYKNRKANEIRRTFFEVNPTKAGYEFSVVRQTYLK